MVFVNRLVSLSFISFTWPICFMESTSWHISNRIPNIKRVSYTQRFTHVSNFCEVRKWENCNKNTLHDKFTHNYRFDLTNFWSPHKFIFMSTNVTAWGYLSSWLRCSYYYVMFHLGSDKKLNRLIFWCNRKNKHEKEGTIASICSMET